MYMDTRKTKRVTQESTEMETFVPESSIKVFLRWKVRKIGMPIICSGLLDLYG